MRPRLIAIFILMLTAAVLAACRSQKPAISVATDRLDLGEAPNGQIVTREVAVNNQGDADLLVDAVSTSCSCTMAAMEPMRLAPGGSGTLHIAVDTGAHGPDLTGPLVRQVFIHSNDPDRPEVTIELTVNITLRQAGDGS